MGSPHSGKARVDNGHQMKVPGPGAYSPDPAYPIPSYLIKSPTKLTDKQELHLKQ